MITFFSRAKITIEMTLQSKTTVYVAIAGVLGLMAAIIGYASLDNEDLQQIEIELESVELKEVNSVANQVRLDVTFLVTNPSDTTLTISIIDYQLYADDVLLGPGLYTTADIALPGRALFYSGAEIPLKNIFVLDRSERNSEVFDSIVNGEITDFSAIGTITSQTSWSETDKYFETSIN